MSRRAVARCAASKPPSLMPALAPQDVDVDTLYMLRINIKNVHDRAHRVKIVPPETSQRPPGRKGSQPRMSGA